MTAVKSLYHIEENVRENITNYRKYPRLFRKVVERIDIVHEIGLDLKYKILIDKESSF